jgi:two-component system sensor histidine kinase RstB
MRQQFVRVYASIAAVLFLGAFATFFLANRAFDQARRAGFEERMTEIVKRIRDGTRQVSGDPDRPGPVFDVLRKSIRFPIRLEPVGTAPLSSEQKRRLREGEVVSVFEGETPRLYAALSEGQLMVTGPFPGPKPGAGRGTFRPPDFVFLGVLAGILLLLGIAIYVLIRPLERRIYALSDVAGRFGQGDLDARAPVDRKDAIADLATTFNRMAERIGDLVERQKELLRAVSHEFRTPLSRLFFLVDEAQTAGEPEERGQQLARIQRTLAEMNDLVEELLTFVRLEGDTAEPAGELVDVASVVHEVVEGVPDLPGGLLVETLCDPVELSVVPHYFRRAVLNLFTNAVRHAREQVRITCSRENGSVRFSVEDDGPGVPEDFREKVLEPFFRLDESRSTGKGGTGLGLAIVQRIMARHGGCVSVGESPLGGARFTLVFPSGGSRAADPVSTDR